MPSTPFERFVAPARAYPQLWRLGLGLGVLLALYVAVAAALLAGFWAVSDVRVLGAETPSDLLSQPHIVLALLTTFLGLWVGTMAAARWLHGRRLNTLLGHGPRVARDFVRCGAIVAGVYALALALWFAGNDAVPNLDPLRWLTLLPLAIAGILIQTGAEELAFRGYLQQQLAARFRSPLAWAVLPSLVFGMLHFDPGMMGANAPVIVGATAFFGLLAADLTAKSGSIGAAWGFHFVNNFFAITILSLDGTITGLSLFTTPFSAGAEGLTVAALAGDLLVMVIAWALCRRSLRR